MQSQGESAFRDPRSWTQEHFQRVARKEVLSPLGFEELRKHVVPELTAFCHFPHLILLDLAEALKAAS